MSWISLTFVVATCTLVSVSSFSTTVTLHSFEVSDGRLANGHLCLNNLCSLGMSLCIDPIDSDLPTVSSCTTGWTSLGRLTDHQNNITFDINATYGGWKNPTSVTLSSKTSTGFQIKCNIFDINGELPIDKFVAVITMVNDSSVKFVHRREKAEPTVLSFSWTKSSEKDSSQKPTIPSVSGSSVDNSNTHQDEATSSNITQASSGSVGIAFGCVFGLLIVGALVGFAVWKRHEIKAKFMTKKLKLNDDIVMYENSPSVNTSIADFHSISATNGRL